MSPAPAPPRNLALRVKLPCDDEKDFYARLADPIAEKGLRVPTANLRPVGSRVRLVLEFRNAATVSGEGVVDAHVEGPRPAMNVRLLRFEPRPAEARAPAPVPPPAPAAASAPVAVPAPPPPPEAAPAAAAEPAAPVPAPPETSFASLFDEQPGAEPQPAAAAHPDAQADAASPERPPIGGTAELPLLYEPAEAQARRSSVPAASRRTAIAAVAAAVALVLGVLAYAVARRPAAPAPPPREPSAGTADAPVVARLAAADQRMSEGRLVGPDGALDHLLAAKALAPEDARVTGRLALLADTLEKLAARALERGDVAEAEVHLAAALQAAPDRQSVAAKLEALGKAPLRPAPARRADDAQVQRP